MGNRFAVPMLSPEDVIQHLANGMGQWRDCRSAKELAKAWWGAQYFPVNIRRRLDNTVEWKDAEIVEAIFEHKTDLGTPGRASQTDLLVLARSPMGMGIIAVEGKANESFGKTVETWLRPASTGDRSSQEVNDAASSPTKLVRLKSLCATLNLDPKDTLNLRYQLLHRSAAAIIEAKRFDCTRALVLVHRFAEGSPMPSSNFDDFSKFTQAIQAPVCDSTGVSKAVVLRDVSVRFTWVDDTCIPLPGLGVRDLITALGMATRLEGVENEFADYWRLRLGILSDLFGLPAYWYNDATRVPRMITSIADASCRGGFFSQFLEYTSLDGEKEIRDRHASRIGTQEYLLRTKLLSFTEELLLRFWPSLEGKFFSDAALVSKGLPPTEPDPLDFI